MPADASTPQPPLATRAGAAARSVAAAVQAAPTTSVVVTAIIALHVYRVCYAHTPLSSLCLAAKPILTDPVHQAPVRLVMSALTHAGWLHLAFNVVALAPLLSRRERAGPGAGVELGCLAAAGNLLFLALGSAAAAVRPLAPYQPGCAVGASGAIFALMVVEASSARPGASVVLAGGALTVPAVAYPFVLAVALQLLMPGLSAAGHGCGLVAGWCLAQARRAGWVSDPWTGPASSGLPTVAAPAESPSWRGRAAAWWASRAPAGGWSPLPSSAAAEAAQPRSVGGAGPTVPPAAAAAAAAEARAAAAAAGGR